MNATARFPVPDHDLLCRLGKGAYGEVWLGCGMTGAYRAIKVVLQENLAVDVERPFWREYEGIERSEPVSRGHPGLVSILHVGGDLEAGYFHYVMEEADDLTTGQQIQPARYLPKTLGQVSSRPGRIPLPDCLPLGLALTEALDHLHQRGLIHRDIKPANVIFVNGPPKLADIGVVTATGRGTVIGTPPYMPPEGPGKPNGDLYSLGKLLYVAWTGQTADQFPELLEDLKERTLPLDSYRFHKVLLRACHTNPPERFQSAREMRAALAEVASPQPVPPPLQAPVVPLSPAPASPAPPNASPSLTSPRPARQSGLGIVARPTDPRRLRGRDRP